MCAKRQSVHMWQQFKKNTMVLLLSLRLVLVIISNHTFYSAVGKTEKVSKQHISSVSSVNTKLK